jgi:chromosome segregation ATPase
MQASDAEATGESQEQRDDLEMFKLQQLTAMERPSWNEGRLDDLNKRVDDGFKRMDAGFAKVDERFEKVDEEFKAVRGEISAGFDRLFWRLVTTGLSLAAVALALAQLL